MPLTSGDGRSGGRQGVVTEEDASVGPLPAEAEASGQAAPPGVARPRRFGGWLRRPPRPPWLPWLLWGGGLLLVAVGLFDLYLRQSRIAPFNSDGATIILQAQSMLNGNVWLHGWWTADVTFYSTELPEYIIVVMFRGLRPDVVHISAAITYMLVVLLGAMLARGRHKGAAGIVRALVAGGILLAPGIIGGTEVMLENPDHFGTAVPILLVLLILDRAPEVWYIPVAVCALLTWTLIADQLTLVGAILPIAAVSLVRMAARAVRLRPLAEFRYDALLLAAAVASDELAKLAEAAMRHLGGFVPHPLPHQLIAPSSQFLANARVMGQALILLFGANYQGTGTMAIIAHFHLIGLALAGAGLAVAVATFFSKRTDRVSQILVAGIATTVAAAILSTELQQLSHTHEVAILLPFGAVLAGRMLPGLVPARWHLRRALVPLLAVWLGCGLAALCFIASWNPLASPVQPLADWLEGHGYTYGLSEYWEANSTTVTSGGEVFVAPVNSRASQVRHWECLVTWYDPTQHYANFVIAVDSPNFPGGGLTTSVVRKAFGKPASEYPVGDYVIMVYDYNLLTKVTGGTFPGN